MTIAEQNRHAFEQMGKRVKQLLDMHGWTKKQLSEKSGVSVHIITEIIRKPDYNGLIINVFRVTNALGLEIDEIFIEDEEWEKLVKTLPYRFELLEKFSHLTEDQKEEVLEFAKKLCKDV